jgi:hypothetical protein
MLKHRLYNIFCDAGEFVRRNKLKLFIFLCFAAFGAVTGVLNARGAGEIYGYGRFNIVLLAKGERTFFGFFCVRLLTVGAIFFGIVLLSYRFFTSVFGAVFVFFYCFLAARSAAVTVLELGVSFLPVLALCVIPFIAAYAVFFTAFAVFALSKSCEFKFERRGAYGFCIGIMLKDSVFFALLLSALCFIESLWAVILTVGISV